MTGVQTCALPILGIPEVTVAEPQETWALMPVGIIGLILTVGVFLGFGILRLLLVEALSGERKTHRLDRHTNSKPKLKRIGFQEVSGFFPFPLYTVHRRQ